MQTLMALRKNRIVLFVVFISILIMLNIFYTGRVLPTTDTKDMWFYSGIFMVLFTTLFIEPYYSSPKNVVTNTVPIILVLIAIKNEFTDQTQWWVMFVFLACLLLVSTLSMIINDKNASPSALRNRASVRLKNISVFFGKGKRLYSGVFLYFLLAYYVGQQPLSWYVFWLLVVWALILLIDQNDLTNAFVMNLKEKDKLAVGQIFGIESQKMFLVKLFDDSKNIKKFDVVKFNHSMRNTNTTYTGIVFDYYLLNRERWAKVLQLNDCDNYSQYLIDNTVYITTGDEKKKLIDELQVSRFAGVVIEGSQIGRIKFEYSKLEDDLQEGDLLELKLDEKRLFYQVVSGSTDKEQLEERNEAGFIEGEAIQIGEWNAQRECFEKFGWVPKINTPVFTADTSDIKSPEPKYPEYKLGLIPKTTLPATINLHHAVSHHMALLGVTGAGKSFLAREIIRELMQDTKIICIDFTGEYMEAFSLLKPISIIDASKVPDIEKLVASKETATKSKNSTEVLKIRGQIQDRLGVHVKEFIESKNSLGIFELPDLSNSSFILEFTQQFLDSIFQYAKSNPGQRICIVLEEAHTIVPEKDSLGDLGDFGSNKAVVSKIGQIALQGRKYGVGFLVIAQRTANVSKTVLTQCNSVVCFQAFDETSYGFLSNYVGKDMVGALPNLPPFHAVVAGKAMKSRVPMIVDLTKQEPEKGKS